MAIDTAAKRQSAAGVPGVGLGPNVTPGTLSTAFGRYTSGWSYFSGGVPPPVTGVQDDRFTLGSIESLAVTGKPTIGGRWGW